jgi:probable HAF family extracellular repeat protein
MFTVVDLLPRSAGVATGMNRRGFVSIAGAGLDASIFVPQQHNGGAGTTVSLASPAGISAEALAINDNADPDIVGWTGIQLPQGAFQQAALWRNCGLGGGTGFLLPTLTQFMGVSLGSARAMAINDSRLIVGWSDVALGGVHRAVVWDGSHPASPPVPLQPLDADLASEANGINNQGQIVGRAQARDAAGNVVFRAVVWDANTLLVSKDLGTLGSAAPIVSLELHAQATAINDAGTIIGVGDLGNQPIRPRTGFVVPPGAAMQVMPMVPSPSAGAWAIAPNGTAALTITVPALPAPADHGATFDLQQGVVDINATASGAPSGGQGLSGGWVLSEARGVNDSGAICGRGSNPFVSNHALLLIP